MYRVFALHRCDTALTLRFGVWSEHARTHNHYNYSLKNGILSRYFEYIPTLILIQKLRDWNNERILIHAKALCIDVCLPLYSGAITPTRKSFKFPLVSLEYGRDALCCAVSASFTARRVRLPERPPPEFPCDFCMDHRRCHFSNFLVYIFVRYLCSISARIIRNCSRKNERVCKCSKKFLLVIVVAHVEAVSILFGIIST